MNRSRYLAAIVAALAIGVGAFLAFDPFSRGPAPSVRYTLLDGRTGDVAALRGRVVLVNFWATSCAVCVREMPQLIETHRRFEARGLETLAVAMRHDAPANVVHFAQTRGLPFPVAIDASGEIAKAFGDVRATPVTLLIDRRGMIVERVVGAPDFAALNARVESLLARS